ncbi:unnamed protein product [Camellia sinensis]
MKQWGNSEEMPGTVAHKSLLFANLIDDRRTAIRDKKRETTTNSSSSFAVAVQPRSDLRFIRSEMIKYVCTFGGSTSAICFYQFIGLQMFTSDEKSYEEEDEVVVYSISVMIVKLSCQPRVGQRLDVKQTWSSTLDLEESERSVGHVDKYYMGPGDQRCRSKKEVLQYINQMNRAAKCTSLTEEDRPVLLLY